MRDHPKEDLDEVMNRKPAHQRFFGHIAFAYFFSIFWIIVLSMVLKEGVQVESQIRGVPNWLILGGAGVLLLKNAYRIIQFHFLDNKK